ncbi:hypothetical protein JWZ98_09915 [Methylomonas sp. EFPC1]|uniref:hypothetical protein n=1 Tax=Methylomonas sp. EFPC1 TaxID=2812647 RepID=UPI001968972B|nr:hypothetical protein [Methylomonas sp. EFPC1]QSB03213.1 hypothetical protein JWZ98_09915 [Methylomonas sp. EFPC1]
MQEKAAIRRGLCFLWQIVSLKFWITIKLSATPALAAGIDVDSEAAMELSRTASVFSASSNAIEIPLLSISSKFGSSSGVTDVVQFRRIIGIHWR